LELFKLLLEWTGSVRRLIAECSHTKQFKRFGKLAKVGGASSIDSFNLEPFHQEKEKFLEGVTNDPKSGINIDDVTGNNHTIAESELGRTVKAKIENIAEKMFRDMDEGIDMPNNMRGVTLLMLPPVDESSSMGVVCKRHPSTSAGVIRGINRDGFMVVFVTHDNRNALTTAKESFPHALAAASALCRNPSDEERRGQLHGYLLELIWDMSWSTTYSRGQAAITLWLVRALALFGGQELVLTNEWALESRHFPYDVRALLTLQKDRFCSENISNFELKPLQSSLGNDENPESYPSAAKQSCRESADEALSRDFDFTAI
jgi:hypothetical protein